MTPDEHREDGRGSAGAGVWAAIETILCRIFLRCAMARMEPAQVTLTFDMGNEASTKYIDLAENLSIVNRKLIRQGQNFAVTGFTLEAQGLDPQTPDQALIKLATLPNNWVTHNAWVKARALWSEMRDLVLDDNPSVVGKWSDFKVLMDAAHANTISYDAGTGAWSTNLYCEDSSGTKAKLTFRDWEYSEVVMPQHDVDPATGLPDAALEHSLHMMGSDVPAGSSYVDGSFGIIEGYENSRAVVQDAPDVPALLDSTWMSLIGDMGSQEPELTQQIEDENDRPPYNRTGYPGASDNLSTPLVAAIASCSASNPVVHGQGFLAPCGLVKVIFSGTVAVKLHVHVAIGRSRGIGSMKMGQ